MMLKRRFTLLILSGLLLVSAACGQQAADSEPPPAPTAGLAQPQIEVATITATPSPVYTPTPVPSPTPSEPLAATVNGRQITLRLYEAELMRYMQGQALLGVAQEALPPDYRTQVLDALIERELILDAAAAAGVGISPEAVDARLAELRAAAGGDEAFAGWLRTNNWTETEYRDALAAELITGLMAEQVTADVPATVEQVRARYIQFDDPTLAQEALNRAFAGDDFGFLAQTYSVDRVTGEIGGDLGFFGRGALLVPELEEAAFAMQIGEVSSVISAPRPDGTTGYYLLRLTDRDPEREMTADERLPLLQAAFDAWLAGLRDAAAIERLVQ